MTLSPDLTKRLTYSKYLLLRAKALLSTGTELASAESVLAAHDGSEMLMRVVTDHLGLKAPDQFMLFWRDAKEATGTEPSLKGAMDGLNSLRVGFKHKGILPNPSVAADLIPKAATFCEETATTFLSLDLNSVSLADLIRNQEARDEVKKAESLSASDLPQALCCLSIAFDLLHKDGTERLELIKKPGWSKTLAMFPKTEYTELGLKQLLVPINQVIGVVNSLLLGVDAARLGRFTLTVPTIPRIRGVEGAGPLANWLRPPEKLTLEDYEFCYQFLVDFALRTENT